MFDYVSRDVYPPDTPMRYIGNDMYLPVDEPIIQKGVITAIGFKYGKPAVQMRVTGARNRRVWFLLKEPQVIDAMLMWDELEVEIHSYGCYNWSESGKMTHLTDCKLLV